MIVRKPGRQRIREVEPCHNCGATVQQRCLTYKRTHKAPCWLSVICHRCAAQPNECRCGVIRPAGGGAWPIGQRDQYGQLELFPIPPAGFIVGEQ